MRRARIRHRARARAPLDRLGRSARNPRTGPVLSVGCATTTAPIRSWRDASTTPRRRAGRPAGPRRADSACHPRAGTGCRRVWDVSVRDRPAADHPRVPRRERCRRHRRLPDVREECPLARVDQLLDDRVAARRSAGGQELRVVPGRALARLRQHGRRVLRRLRHDARPALRPFAPDLRLHGRGRRRHVGNAGHEERPPLRDLLQRRHRVRGVRQQRQRLADVPVGQPGLRPGRHERGADHGRLLRRRDRERCTDTGAPARDPGPNANTRADSGPDAGCDAGSDADAGRNRAARCDGAADASSDPGPDADADAGSDARRDAASADRAAGRWPGRADRAASTSPARSRADRDHRAVGGRRGGAGRGRDAATLAG